MHLSTLGLFFLLANLHLAVGAPTSDGGPSISEPPPVSSNPPPDTTIPRTTPSPRPTSSDVSTSTPPAPTTSIAVPPSGGGQTCVQNCLTLAAADAGCNSYTDSACVCSSSSYMSDAQNCFSTQNCDPAAVMGANRDYSSICRNLSASTDSTTTSDSTSTSSSTLQPSRTENPVTRTAPPSSRIPESTVHTVETVIIQSGAVITVSGAIYTAGAAVTTTFSGQMGDFAAGAGATTLGVNNDAGSSTSVPNSSRPDIITNSPLLITMSTLLAGALIGGLSCVLV